MGLRLAEGLDLSRHDLQDRFDRKAVERLQGHGYLSRSADRLTVTPAGRCLLDAILREIVL